MSKAFQSDGVRGMVGDESADGDDRGTSAAESFGDKIGIPAGLLAFYILFVGPERIFRLSSAAGDLLTMRTGQGNDPLVVMAGAVLVSGLVAGVTFPLVAEELTEKYRSDLAMGVLTPSVVVVLLVLLVALLEPIGNALLTGDLLLAATILVAEIIGIVIAIGSTVGIIAAAVIFGVYFGIPSYIGVFVGSLVGRLGRRVGGNENR
ncbi:hypothetical protein [Haloarchaeobius baliensis]|uniref:hypothetical protein n=1 Tax=Haloarchaeobius baliensis TaxID=1670458 RepID=UPI003F881A26